MRMRLFLSAVIFLVVINSHAQAKRYDTSVKIGKVGYKVYSNNKGVGKNTVSISPIGFESTAHEINIEVKGRVSRAEVDDLNNDGFPDLVLYIYSGGAKNTGTVIGISSDKNQGFIPIYFPDITDDLKLRVGYLGNDEFFLMEGTLMRRFPVNNTSDTANVKPTTIIRQVQYRVGADEKGVQKFKVTRSYELNKQ